MPIHPVRRAPPDRDAQEHHDEIKPPEARQRTGSWCPRGHAFGAVVAAAVARGAPAKPARAMVKAAGLVVAVMADEHT